MAKLKDLTGMKFGRLTVIKRVEDIKRGRPRWLCKCDCGNMIIVLSHNLTNNRTKSCGCIRDGVIYHYKHGLSKHPLRNVWHSMKTRCCNSNDSHYKNYGGRGITICDEWLNDLENFYNWAINNGYEEGLTIDRIDVNGNYEPSNCRWVTNKAQQNNKTNNRLITFNGETHTVAEWADIKNISYNTLYHRIFIHGWSIEKALLTPNKREVNNKRIK